MGAVQAHRSLEFKILPSRKPSDSKPAGFCDEPVLLQEFESVKFCICEILFATKIFSKLGEIFIQNITFVESRQRNI